MSRQSVSLLAIAITAAAAIAAHRAVGYDNETCGTAGEKVKGVANAAIASGDQGALDVIGTTIIETGDAIAEGDDLATDAQGRAIPASALAVAAGATGVTSSAANGAIFTGGSLPQHVFASALQGASGAGAFIEIRLR